jgi:hypothetical protein
MLNQISKDMINLIGISGKKGSGKDTVGKIIQYLTSKYLAGYTYPSSMQTFNEFIINGHRIRSDWQIKKFADPLKDIVCILTGCTREQLEDEAFKNSKLPDEWSRYSVTVEIPNTKSETKYYSTLEEMKNRDWFRATTQFSPISVYEKVITLTYRDLLQYVGTDLIRNQLHEDVWINAVFSKYKVTLSEGWIPTYNNPDNHNFEPMAEPIYPNWIITDVRFPNELKAIEKRGGIIIRVDRHPEYKWIDKKEWDYHTKGTIPHPSETALDNHDFKYTINNNGSIDDLIVSVDNLLKTLGLK